MSTGAFPWGTIAAAGAGGTASPVVSPRADGDSNLVSDTAPAICYQGCDFDIDGDEWENTPAGLQTNSTVWLDSGSSSDVWVEFVRTAGTQTKWDFHNSSQRYQINVNQRFSMVVESDLQGDDITKSITGFFRMWDAASGGNTLWTGSTVTWSCRVVWPTGPCSSC